MQPVLLLICSALLLLDCLLAPPWPACSRGFESVLFAMQGSAQDAAALAPQHTQAAYASPTAPARAAADSDFSCAAAKLAACQSASEMRALAVGWRAQEGKARTPLVLLQALALTAEYATKHPVPPPKASRRRLASYGEKLKEHGQTRLLFSSTLELLHCNR
jgi:hypothetical protein